MNQDQEMAVLSMELGLFFTKDKKDKRFFKKEIKRILKLEQGL